MRIEYCPTGDMWADIHTKPLQEATFAKFQQLILNLGEHHELNRTTRVKHGEQLGTTAVCSQECVGENVGNDDEKAGHMQGPVSPTTRHMEGHVSIQKVSGEEKPSPRERIKRI